MKNKFNPGDKVICIKKSSKSLLKGCIYTIKLCGFEFIWINEIDSECFRIKNFELVDDHKFKKLKEIL
jgi:hypothetical protein